LGAGTNWSKDLTAYYNEIDPYAAQWLRNLIAAGHIAPGIVDERSIEDVEPIELATYTQCHFFAGIGVWSLALRRAGWPDDKPIWTGSCPCQPFSSAGKGAGFDDERHLWPAFHHLIEQRRPAMVIGEQVASKDSEPWLDLVQTDLEALDYAFGAVPFPSASVGAPHIRDRLYWVADTQSQRTTSDKFQRDSGERQQLEGAGAGRNGSNDGRDATQHPRTGPTNGFWGAADWLLCRDGKWRPVEPGTFPLAHGATSRVGRLRAYGNAINAQAAQVFIECIT
jgi:DNA (cytosine-5)-methyltransferase 1